jgi:prevent-host-death family protein
MKSVGAYEAKTRLSSLLDDVERGESIAITRHGQTIAVLVPPLEQSIRGAAGAINEWRAYRSKHKLSLGDLSIRELIEAGRR